MYVDLLLHLFVYQQDKQANEFLRIQVLCSHAGEHDACDVTSEVVDIECVELIRGVHGTQQYCSAMFHLIHYTYSIFLTTVNNVSGKPLINPDTNDQSRLEMFCRV